MQLGVLKMMIVYLVPFVIISSSAVRLRSASKNLVIQSFTVLALLQEMFCIAVGDVNVLLTVAIHILYASEDSVHLIKRVCGPFPSKTLPR